MLFNSLHYAVFLPLAFLCHWLTPQRWRWAVLLAFSYYFYMSWDPQLVWLILFTTAVSWAAALLIQRAEKPALRRAALVAGCLLCFACLFFFKYFDFLSESLAALARLAGFAPQPLTLDLVLPVGISFYTFQTVSYIVDVYRGRMRAERHIGYYALYVSFFPQLVAGPIERADRLLPQLRAPRRPEPARCTAGLQKILAGLFKKIVIAETLAPYVDAVYNDLPGKTGLTLLFATFLFAMQIYCDFSGYSDIAVGSAALLGVDLMENFKSPYFARSVREFWRRWHISLTTWFTDYVYIPLGGSRCGTARHLFNLVFTFFCSGLWHGAAWHFVAWGVFHGLWLCLEQLYVPRLDAWQKRLRPLPAALLGAARTVYTLAVVTLGWVFFRANTLADAAYVFANLWRGLNPLRLPEYMACAGLTAGGLAVILLLLALLALYDGWSCYRRPVMESLASARPVWRYLLYYGMAAAIGLALMSRPYGAAADFIYFQF